MITAERILKILKNSPSLDVYSNHDKEELSFHLGEIINEMNSFTRIFENEEIEEV